MRRFLLVALLVSVCCANTFAGDLRHVETVTVRAPAKFVVEENGPGGIPGVMKITDLVIPIDGFDYRIFWSKEISGKMYQHPPHELEEGKQYTFVIRRYVDADEVEHIMDITADGVMIYSEAWTLKGKGSRGDAEARRRKV